jgi:transcriptional regulator with XRE-family HTH domain
MRDLLIAIQQREGWNDGQMAERLSISRSAWNMIRNGNLPLSERVQMKAAGAFPELLGALVTSVTLTRQVA